MMNSDAALSDDDAASYLDDYDGTVSEFETVICLYIQIASAVALVTWIAFSAL
jgi:hypothetical protein